MITAQALDIVLMAAKLSISDTGPIRLSDDEKVREAIEEVQELLKSYEDNDYKDEDQDHNVRTNATGHTFLFSSVMINNIPSHRDGKSYAHSSEGTHNLIRYVEEWGSGATFHMKGSTVIMNTRQYGLDHIAYKNENPNKSNTVYVPPNRDFKMNYDLFTKPGQPPFTPFGIQVVRTVNNIDMMD